MPAAPSGYKMRISSLNSDQGAKEIRLNVKVRHKEHNNSEWIPRLTYV